jgi:prephenate dehydrogenase
VTGAPARLAILGTGLIGASIGLAARTAGWKVTGYDPDPAAAAEARERGALDEVAAGPAEAVAGARVVVVAAPVAATIALLAAFPPAPAAELVIDTASVKAPVAAAASAVRHFVATHPIAGSERSGPAPAHADLFRGRAWAIVPPADAALEAAAFAFVRSLGARPFRVGAGRHDRLIAATSHLPQLIATALGERLAGRLDDPDLAALCGPGVRSSLRLAASPWSTWRDILDANASAVAQEVRGFADVLRSVADDVERGDREALARRFGAAGEAHARLSANDGSGESVSQT